MQIDPGLKKKGKKCAHYRRLRQQRHAHVASLELAASDIGSKGVDIELQAMHDNSECVEKSDGRMSDILRFHSEGLGKCVEK